MSASSSSNTGHKRRRTVEGDQAYPPINEMTKDSTLWYSDGNIVVGAGQTLFRVHKSILSQHSTVFGDMLGGFPHSGDFVEGCPFVRLFGDDPAEVRCMLQEMYGLRGREDRKVSIELLCALIRLGRKYDVAAMQKLGVSILRELYGPDLQPFKARQWFYGNGTTSDRFSDNKALDFPVRPWKREFCFVIYALARDHEMKHTAARALYECCHFPLAMLNTTLIPTLTPDIFWACALGREELPKRGAAQLLKLDPEQLEGRMNRASDLLGCEKTRTCKPLLEKTFDLVKSGVAPARFDILGVDCRREAFFRKAREGLCSHCRINLDSVMWAEGKAAWKALPDLFATAMKGSPI
ncbi:hypothetical protein PENSPDRAFT_351972 [Peniophora sp. CONT]|nr:hypothetical protein PENSPDRAFT_351972 [Peniophora sp. CONT]